MASLQPIPRVARYEPFLYCSAARFFSQGKQPKTVRECYFIAANACFSVDAGIISMS